MRRKGKSAPTGSFIRVAFTPTVFLNLTMLAGIAGALLPVMLHFLSRSRYRTVDWGAMMFLQGADGAIVRGSRIKQLVILLLRIAIVACVAMALAQPVVRGRWGTLARDARICSVIILDCSASMGFDEGGKSRLELARSAVLNILETLRENRVGIVILGGGRGELDPLAQPTTDLQQLAQRVMALPEPNGRADLSVGLSQAADILSRAPESAREIYVVCDRQASSWREAGTEAFASTWRPRLERAGTQTRFFVVPVGSQRAENLGIDSIELIDPPAIAGQEAEVEVKVHNYGSSYRAGTALKVDDKVVPVAVGPETTVAFRTTLRFWQPGTRLVTASLDGTGLKFDDRMQAAVDVIEPIRVLIVSGDERGTPLQSESDFLRVALAPRVAEARLRGAPGADKLRGDPCRVDVEPFEKWNEQHLRNFQVVVLANVPQLTQSQAIALEQFVYEGGGLWIAPGNLCRVDNYNVLLWRDGTGIMPLRLLPPTPEDGSGATTIQGISDFEHPVLKFLKGRPDPIPPVTIGRYFPAEVRQRDAKVLAQFASGRPFLVEGITGRARVLVSTIPIDADWSTLPLSNFYLPMAQSAVRHLAGSWAGERNLVPGQPLIVRVPATYDVRKAELRVPAGEGREARLVPLPVTRGEVRYSATHVPGIYDLRLEGNLPDWARRIPFVVQTPRIESDMASLSPAQWSELARRLNFDVLDPEKDSLSSAVIASRGGKELWLTLVIAAISLCVAEMAIVRRWAGEGVR